MAIKSGIIPLLNSIVDVCLVYGIDETSKVLELESVSGCTKQTKAFARICTRVQEPSVAPRYIFFIVSSSPA